MTDATITIRRADLRDAEALAPLFDLYRQFYEQPSNAALARQFLLERFRRDESTVFMAEGDAPSPVGFAQLFPTFSSVSLARAFVLNDLFVAPEFRRRGIAQALLSAAVDFCRNIGAVRISLSTAVTNAPARALYEANGWTRQTDYDVYLQKL